MASASRAPAAVPDTPASPEAAAPDSFVGRLDEELQHLTLQKETIDDLRFAYELQFEEVLRASAENAGVTVSRKMFAPESEECLQRRAAVEAQVSYQLSDCCPWLAQQICRDLQCLIGRNQAQVDTTGCNKVGSIATTVHIRTQLTWLAGGPAQRCFGCTSR